MFWADDRAGVTIKACYFGAFHAGECHLTAQEDKNMKYQITRYNNES